MTIPIADCFWRGRRIGDLSKDELITDVIYHLLAENKDLKDRYLKVDRFVLVDLGGLGRVVDTEITRLQLMVQDEGRTLKVLLNQSGRKRR
jgi:hypothetical protein